MIPQLRTDIGGRVIGPHDAGYDATRAVFYGKFDRRPAARGDRLLAIKGQYDPTNPVPA